MSRHTRLYVDLSWMKDAACADERHLFFPANAGGVKVAKAICAGCGAKQRCLEYALANHEIYGVWGETSERERRRILRDRRSAA